jgi:hypothetical protein
MYQTPQPLWNEIAKTQELKTPLWREMFKATNPQEALQPLEDQLQARGADARVIRAFLLVDPLLKENLAISRFIEATGRDSLRSGLPEILTVNEATTLASQEFRLKPSQQKMLQTLLKAEWTMPPSAAPSEKPTNSQ